MFAERIFEDYVPHLNIAEYVTCPDSVEIGRCAQAYLGNVPLVYIQRIEVGITYVCIELVQGIVGLR